jgi:hypothetical protein
MQAFLLIDPQEEIKSAGVSFVQMHEGKGNLFDFVNTGAVV